MWLKYYYLFHYLHGTTCIKAPCQETGCEMQVVPWTVAPGQGHEQGPKSSPSPHRATHHGSANVLAVALLWLVKC